VSLQFDGMDAFLFILSIDRYLKSDPSPLFARRVFGLIYRSIVLSIIEFYS
jgi:hypothetical protein